MRSYFALLAVGAAILVGVFGGSARAAPGQGQGKTPPTPASALALPDNGTVSTTVTLADGTVEPVTITTSSSVAAPAKVDALGGDAGVAAAASLSCWTAKNEVDYGPSWAIIMTYAQTIGWCGNGSTISGTPGQQIAAKVTGTGQVTFWQFDGVIDKEMTRYYAGWAFQAYTEGHFHQCPIIQFACFDDKYPQLWMNVYANGARERYWSG